MIVYNKRTHTFRIETPNTLYALLAKRGERPEHLYYGKRVKRIPTHVYMPVYGFSPNDADKAGIDDSHDIRFNELPAYGAGDFRLPAIRIVGRSGASATDFRLVRTRVYRGKPLLSALPHARTGEAQTLELTLADRANRVNAYLSYTVYDDSDVIVRSVTYENVGRSSVSLHNVASVALDLPGTDYDVITLPGSYGHERGYERAPLRQGTFTVGSRRGASSHQANPAFALTAHEASETAGDVFAFNIIYSGSFTNSVEATPHGDTRAVLGLGDESFSWRLGKGERFEAPEGIMLYAEGLTQMRHRMHAFVKKYVLYPRKEAHAPVVLNTWEGTWFDINEEKILAYADAAAANDIEMLVMDDGWFGNRTSDSAGLGDWYVNKTRFPRGLGPMIDEIHQKGLRFGIWIEPEMVNPDSDLYRAHPEYVLAMPGREPSLSRRQLVLDMGNPNVIRYLEEALLAALGDAPIDYVKWDFNRHLCDVYSSVLPPERQGEAAHRFLLGTYELLGWLRATFPRIMLETCSGGGGRYDLGMMYFGEQIWTSDNTEPGDRIRIQCSSLFAYPAATMSCHVSNHNGICEKSARAMRFRYAVASAGPLGYEFELGKCSEQVCRTVREQIAEYKSYAHLPESGLYTQLLSPYEGPVYAYYYASEAGDEFLLTALAEKGTNAPILLSVAEAEENESYTDRLTGKVYEGALLKAGLPLSPDGEEEWSFMAHLVKN